MEQHGTAWHSLSGGSKTGKIGVEMFSEVFMHQSISKRKTATMTDWLFCQGCALQASFGWGCRCCRYLETAHHALSVLSSQSFASCKVTGAWPGIPMRSNTIDPYRTLKAVRIWPWISLASLFLSEPTHVRKSRTTRSSKIFQVSLPHHNIRQAFGLMLLLTFRGSENGTRCWTDQSLHFIDGSQALH